MCECGLVKSDIKKQVVSLIHPTYFSDISFPARPDLNISIDFQPKLNFDLKHKGKDEFVQQNMIKPARCLSLSLSDKRIDFIHQSAQILLSCADSAIQTHTRTHTHSHTQ